MFVPNPGHHTVCSEPSFDLDLAARIMVKAPYNRLYELKPCQDQGVQAQVLLEGPACMELGGPSSAELGRHMAILGSCALARGNRQPGAFFYLAKSAHIRRVNTQKNYDSQGRYHLVAVPQNAKTVEVRAVCAQTQDELAHLTCSYQKLSPRLFERLFGQYKIQIRPDPAVSPYGMAVQWETLELDATHGKATIETVSPEMCVGHFNDYPALPVAVLMDCINHLACEHLKHAQQRYAIVNEGQIEAERLAFAGEQLQFSVELLDSSAKSVDYQGLVRNLQGEVFAHTNFRYHVEDTPR